MPIFAFQIDSTGDFVLVSASSRKQARKILTDEVCADVDILDMEDAKDVLDNQYNGLAFLTTEPSFRAMP